MNTLADLVSAIRTLSSSGESGPEPVRAALTTALADSSDWLDARYLDRDPAADWALHPLLRAENCSVLAVVFRPGAAVPVHDHGSWAVIGIYRGRERETRYGLTEGPGPLEVVGTLVNAQGDVTVVPRDVAHTVEALDGDDAVSIHVYGTDIVTRERHTYDVETGETQPYRPRFVEPATASRR
ncbi:MAG TPA: cysteine dioxygenase family protein [Pseudonocardia sp.]|nr:cysteine dioxygenase family protein [Pseudonocardia sp.]